MNFKDIINRAVSLIQLGSREQALNSLKSWIARDYTLYVTDGNAYNECLESLYEIDKLVAERFSRKTVHDFLHKRLKDIKVSGESFDQSMEIFYKEFHNVKPNDITVTAPVSGVRIDGKGRLFGLSVFNFGYLEDLDFPIFNEKGMYISILLGNVYDKNMATQRAENAFKNFAKLIVFISGKLDRSILIETGLPLRPSLSHEQMYVSTSSYQMSDKNGPLDMANISNRYLEKIPVNNDFFSKNADFKELWGLYHRKHKGEKLNDLESRLLNSAIALGESAMTFDARNSIIYTCIALEILFSFDSGSLFQKSIGEKLSEIFSFIVANDKDSRLMVGKLVKKVYAMRSAIVHGGDKDLSSENLIINSLMRRAIKEFLHGERFNGYKNISQVYDSLKEAQNSY